MKVITSVQFKPKIEGMAQVWNLIRRCLSRKQDLHKEYQFNVAETFFLSFLFFSYSQNKAQSVLRG